jgi:hypothetical protein
VQREFEARRAAIRSIPEGIVPELVLVLEIAGGIEGFNSAVKRIRGLEWLAEWQEERDPDGDFYSEEDPARKLGGTLFLVLSNHTALEELLRLWRRYRQNRGAPLDHGFGRFKALFAQLRDIRLWGPEDRLKGTGLREDWERSIAGGEEIVRTEIELWFRGTERDRNEARTQVETILRGLGGSVLAECQIAEIRYHAVLGQVPATAARTLLQSPEVELLRCDDVMFFRPVGQCAITTGAEPETFDGFPSDIGILEEPIAAILDGLPIENHAALAGRITVDDPDGWAAGTPVTGRAHGTAMACVVLHGDLEARETPLRRRIYMRPIMKSEPSGMPDEHLERVPTNELPLDLIYRAVRRIFEGEGDVPAASENVRIINLSVCDPARSFERSMSPWGRLIDWLSWKYNVLFVLSAGNYGGELVLDSPRGGFNLDTHPAPALRSLTLRALLDSLWRRRLMSPAEAVNAVAIGALQSDAQQNPPTRTGVRDPIACEDLLNPVTALGPGYARSVKPDVMLPGGRQLYSAKQGTSHHQATLIKAVHARGPGIRVASPSRSPGGLRDTCFTVGTSNAAALATRTLCEVYDALHDARMLPVGREAVLLKALLVHGALWGDGFGEIRAACNGEDRNTTRLLGYGRVSPDRCTASADGRVTLVCADSIRYEESHIHAIPLPDSLSSVRVWRRVIATLAWISPINPAHQAYRQASLWFDSIHADKNPLLVERAGPEQHHVVVRRGTVQHEVLEGERAAAFEAERQLRIKVNARKSDGDPRVADRETQIHYALAVTLEVKEEVGLRIYEEVQTKLQARVRV